MAFLNKLEKFIPIFILKRLPKNNLLKKAVRKRVEREFLDIRKEMLQDFDNHVVTKELEAGPEAINLSATLVGTKGGNLFTYIGFYEDHKPILELRNLIKSYKINFIPSKDSVKLRIIIPSKEDIFRSTPVPWAKGRSWVKGIEHGLSGFGKYMPTKTKRNISRSGGAIQVKKDLRKGRFKNKSYLSPIYKKYTKRIERLKRLFG